MVMATPADGGRDNATAASVQPQAKSAKIRQNPTVSLQDRRLPGHRIGWLVALIRAIVINFITDLLCPYRHHFGVHSADFTAAWRHSFPK